MCHSEEFFKGFQILLWWCGSPHRVLTSCLLALASAAPERHPRLGGNQTLRRRQTRQAHNNNKKTCSHTKSEEVTVTHALEAGLTDVRPVRDDQPFLPVFQTCAPPPKIQVDTQQTEGGGGGATHAERRQLTFAFALVLCGLFEQAREVDHHAVTWGRKEQKHKDRGGQGVTCRGVRTLKRKGILFTRSNQPERASVAPSGPNVSLHHRRRTNLHATCVPIS